VKEVYEYTCVSKREKVAKREGVSKNAAKDPRNEGIYDLIKFQNAYFLWDDE
jgi:hypothetical protein